MGGEGEGRGAGGGEEGEGRVFLLGLESGIEGKS